MKSTIVLFGGLLLGLPGCCHSGHEDVIPYTRGGKEVFYSDPVADGLILEDYRGQGRKEVTALPMSR